MALPSEELQKKLARRRSLGEEVFERDAAPSVADATAHMVMGAAAYDGSAFETALEKIRAFEARTMAPAQSIGPAGTGVGCRMVEPSSTPALVSSHSVAMASDSNIESVNDGPGSIQVPKRQEDYKSAVRERFAALIHEGLAPNEAAAQAIREVAGQQAGAGSASLGHEGVQQQYTGNDQATDESCDAAVVSSPGSSPRSEGSTQRSCASSAKDNGAKCSKKKTVVVVA